MENREVLLKELEQIPDPILVEILNYVRFLKAKAAQEEFSSAHLSENILAKDWLLPEEDDAWNDL